MMSIKIFCVFFLFYANHVCLSHDLPEVRTPLGKIRGTWGTSSNGRTYAAFNGIPFAKPPIGQLRFEEPQPIDPWPGVWDATTSHTCTQYSMKLSGKIEDIKFDNFEVVGEEDCLYLNVFVPSGEIDPQKNYDVLVSIHGGGFMIGSGHFMVNLSTLMDKDIIIVTNNYRVGILGFLSTEDDAVPGNNGMKDQALALQWVKENIASFGGNPNSVTITGVSAGGASVHLHYFSQLSKGLFNRGISHSGTALDPWVIKENPLENARKLGALVGCSDGSTQELKECLKSRPAVLLVEKVGHFEGYDRVPISPFAPVVEKNSKSPFLAKNPYALLREKDVLDVPWIVSTCADEGTVPAAMYYEKLEEIDNRWPEIAHYLLDSNYTVPIAKREVVAKQLKDFYLGPGEHISQTTFKKFSQIFTDRMFTIGAEIAAKLQSEANKSPVYYYLFNYLTDHSVIRMFVNSTELKAVSHGDDAGYFYGVFFFNGHSEADKKLQNICINILNSYVTTGKPSLDGTDIWKPTGASELTYLNITGPEDIKLQTTKFLTPLEFWKKLGFSEYENLVIKDEL